MNGEDFYVFNQAGDDGFHDIKNASGIVITNSADTSDYQIAANLEACGYPKAQYEIIYDRAAWDQIGKK